MKCDKSQPKGYTCTREQHDGPCALKQSFWSKVASKIGNAIGNSKFGGGGN